MASLAYKHPAALWSLSSSLQLNSSSHQSHFKVSIGSSWQRWFGDDLTTFPDGKTLVPDLWRYIVTLGTPVGANKCQRILLALLQSCFASSQAEHESKAWLSLVSLTVKYLSFFMTSLYHFVLILLAPQSGALRISAYRDFQSQSNPIHL